MHAKLFGRCLADRRDPLYDRRTLHLQFPSAAAREMDYLNAWRRRHSNGWCSEVRELDEGLFVLVAIDHSGQELLHAASYENLKAAVGDGYRLTSYLGLRASTLPLPTWSNTS